MKVTAKFVGAGGRRFVYRACVGYQTFFFRSQTHLGETAEFDTDKADERFDEVPTAHSAYEQYRKWMGQSAPEAPAVAADNVNHPPHYTHGKIEVIDAIEDWRLGFHDGNVVKYVARHRHKGGVEDLKKARWYLNRLIEKLENESASPRAT